jgi:hypothetical protein
MSDHSRNQNVQMTTPSGGDKVREGLAVSKQRWHTFHMENYLFQLLNALRASDVRQIEMHAAEPLVPDPSRS